MWHQHCGLSLRISSINVMKSAVADSVKFTEEILNGKLHFLCSAYSVAFITKFEQVF